MTRPDGRRSDELRRVEIQTGYLKHPDGSVLVSAGDTRIICTASVEDRVPAFLKDTGKGWVTSEYAMIPGATDQRSQRDSSRGQTSGRSQEIQRLIGRSLRTAVDLRAVGERTVWMDCDVLQADGGTRTLSITGAFVALSIALAKLMEAGKIRNPPILCQVAAVSVGVVAGQEVLDLCYEEDSGASTDMNVVMNERGAFIEVQGTAEQAPFSRQSLDRLLDLALAGGRNLMETQRQVLGVRLEKLRLPPLGKE